MAWHAQTEPVACKYLTQNDEGVFAAQLLVVVNGCHLGSTATVVMRASAMLAMLDRANDRL